MKLNKLSNAPFSITLFTLSVKLLVHCFIKLYMIVSSFSFISEVKKKRQWTIKELLQLQQYALYSFQNLNQNLNRTALFIIRINSLYLYFQLNNLFIKETFSSIVSDNTKIFGSILSKHLSHIVMSNK